MGRYISNTNTNSYQDNELLLLKQGFAKNCKEFLTAGTDTWTIDHDVIARVRVWGGGGGGGGGYDRGKSTTFLVFAPGGGGGAGGAAEAILRLKAGTYNITVGAGGTAGAGAGPTSSVDAVSAGTDGGNGGSSSFHTYITCSGGFGGSKAAGRQNAVLGGVGGAATFNRSGFDGFLYIDGQFGGAGGSFRPVYHAKSENESTRHLFKCDLEGGAGESGGFTGGALNNDSIGGFMGGGGGGYNAPFIYVTDTSVRANSGRGVGAGGAGGSGAHWRSVPNLRPGFAGNSGAVVIEWN